MRMAGALVENIGDFSSKVFWVHLGNAGPKFMVSWVGARKDDMGAVSA